MADAALLDDGIAFRSQAGAHEDVLDVAQPGLTAVDEVFALARAEQAPGDGHFGRLGGVAGDVAIDTRLGRRIDQRHGDRSHAEGLALPCTGEDDVLHAGAAQGFGGLLAQHPADGVAQVRLSAPVRAYDGGNASAIESQLSPVAKGLEALDLDAF